MKITVRCFLIPADITFDTDDVTVTYSKEDKHAEVVFNTESEDPIKISVDKDHYLAEIAKNRIV